MKTSLFKTTVFGFATLSVFLSCHWGWDLERTSDPCPLIIDQSLPVGKFGDIITIKGEGFIADSTSFYRILIDGEDQHVKYMEIPNTTTLRFRVPKEMKGGALSVQLIDGHCEAQGNNSLYFIKCDTFVGHKAPCLGCLDNPSGLDVDSDGHVWVADAFNDVIRDFDASGSQMTPYGSSGECSQADGFVSSVHFNRPVDVLVNASKVIYVAERIGKVIRKLTGGVDGRTSTIAGQCRISASTPSSNDCHDALMSPQSIAQYGNYLYMVDNDAVRRLDESTPCTIKTLLYNKGLLTPTAIAVSDKRMDGPVFVGVDNTIMAIKENDDISTLPMATDGSRFHQCTAMAIDGNGNIFIADKGQNQIYVLYKDGALKEFLSVPCPTGLAIDGRNGILYVAKTDEDNPLGNLILKYNIK